MGYCLAVGVGVDSVYGEVLQACRHTFSLARSVKLMGAEPVDCQLRRAVREPSTASMAVVASRNCLRQPIRPLDPQVCEYANAHAPAALMRACVLQVQEALAQLAALPNRKPAAPPLAELGWHLEPREPQTSDWPFL